MKSIGVISVAVLLLFVSNSHASNGNSKMKPSQWMSSAQLEEIPSIEEMNLEQLEQMSVESGAKQIEYLYHLSQLNHNLKPSFVPSASNIACYIYKPNGQKVTTTLDKLAVTSKQQPNFGNEEVTIFITGYPSSTDTIKKANWNLVEAYLQRYSNKKWQQKQKYETSGEKIKRTSSEEDDSDMLHQQQQQQQSSMGDIVVIDLGSKLNPFKRAVLLDTEETGVMVASALMELIKKCEIPDEIIHIVAQGVAAHVAGAAGNEYSRHTGRQLRRITALDPSKLYARDPQTLTGLARGDAEFVDAIHTNVYGLGTIQRVGDIDFYPHGINAAVPGAKSIVESSMRATRYFAESVRPGNERNFPAIAANSLAEYKNYNGHGKRVYMGIDTDYDVRGDYVLEVNEKSPFGKRTPAQKQSHYNGVHNY